MKIERISDNQIKCTISSRELKEHNLNTRDLARGTKDARALLRDVMIRANEDFGFETDNIPLMIQTISSTDTDTTILVTRVTDSEASKKEVAGIISKEISDLILNSGKEHMPERATSFLSLNEQPDVPKYLSLVFSFSSLDQAISASKRIADKFTGMSFLMREKSTGKYFMSFESTDKPEAKEAAKIINLLSEYGRFESASPYRSMYVTTHYDLIIEPEAVSVLSKL